jgi:hypothetical protein
VLRLRGFSMRRIVGTHHSKIQFWSDAIRRNESFETCHAMVEQFQQYLLETAQRFDARVIAEENNERLVEDRGRFFCC